MVQSLDEATGRATYSSYRPELSVRSDDIRNRVSELLSQRFSNRGGGRTRGGDSEANSPRGGRVRSGRSTTLEDGSFILKGLPDGVFRVQSSHDIYVALQSDKDLAVNTVDGAGTSISDIRLIMKDGAKVFGRVQVSGQIAPGASVSLSGGLERKNVVADATGRFEVLGLGPGTYRLRARVVNQESSRRERGPRGGENRRPTFRREESTGPSVTVTIEEKAKEVEVDINIE